MNSGKVTIDRDFLRREAVDAGIFSAFVEHLGNVIYNGIYNPSHPTANEDGFRQDVIDLVKELHLTNIRYPGGNFVCTYRWEDTVGPVEERPVRLDLAWRQTEPNRVGLAEFEKWVKAVGGQLMMSVNLSTRGAVDAANLVEYCNYPSGSYYSDLRRRHGHEEPYNIRLWCVGNEVDGDWNIGKKRAKDYGWDAREAVKAMHKLDPEIRTVAVGSSGTQLATYLNWDREVLEKVYDVCDYLSLHRYMGMPDIDDPASYDYADIGDWLELSGRLERNIEDVVAACDYVKGRKHSDKTMYLSMDEYNVLDVRQQTEENREPAAPWQVGPEQTDRGLSMKDTLLFGLGMLVLLRHSDRIKIACHAILINGGGGLVMCGKEGKAWVNGTYHIFRHCSLYGRGKVLEQVTDSTRYDTAHCKDVPALDAVCIYHEETGELDVFVVNKAGEPMEFCLRPARFGRLSQIEHLVVAATLDAYNREDNQEVISPVGRQDIQCGAEEIRCVLDPYSWNVLRLETAQADLNGS